MRCLCSLLHLTTVHTLLEMILVSSHHIRNSITLTLLLYAYYYWSVYTPNILVTAYYYNTACLLPLPLLLLLLWLNG